MTSQTEVTFIRFKLTIAYDGTAYQGWQEQKTGTGVQQKIQDALAKLFPSQPKLHSASRTDSGVHALGMVAHFDIPASEFRKRHMQIRHLPLAINAWLPDDIRIVKAQRVRPDFHARFDAVYKQYRYFVWNHPVMNPLLRHMAWHVPRPLDLAAMRAAAKAFIGRHDFKAFAANPGYQKENTVRAVTRCELKKSGALLTFIIEADGFLYKMCRGIVGTIVQVGLGKFTPEQIKQMLQLKDRRVAGMNAPAHGLVLWKITYTKPATPNHHSKPQQLGQNESRR